MKLFSRYYSDRKVSKQIFALVIFGYKSWQKEGFRDDRKTKEREKKTESVEKDNLN